MTAPRFPPGRIVGGKFSIQSELGHGHVSTTYRAITAPNREVAIRFLDPSLPNVSGVVDALRQAHAAGDGDLGRFFAPIVEAGWDDQSGAPFLVVPLISTPSLAHLVELCPFEPKDAVAMARSLGRALDALHAKGQAHFNLKPTNVFVGPGPEFNVQLTDMSSPLLWRADGAVSSWLAPEQRAGDGPVGPSADRYTMALVVLHALTGAPLPLPASSHAALLAASEHARARGVTLPTSVDSIFRRALANDSAERPVTAGAWVSELAAVLGMSPGRAAPVYAPAESVSAAAEPPLADPRMPPAIAGSSSDARATPSEANLSVALPNEVDLRVAPQPNLYVDSAQLASVPSAFALGPPTPADPLGSAAESSGGTFVAKLGKSLRSGAQRVGSGVRRLLEHAELGKPLRGALSQRVLLVAGAYALAVVLFGAGITMITLAMRGRARASAPTPTAKTATASTVVSSPASANEVVRSPPTSAPAPKPAPPPSTEPSATAAIAGDSTGVTPLGRGEAELTVICEPLACDLVKIDGKVFRHYPKPVVVRAGFHGIGISRKGFGGQWQGVKVSEGERTSVRFTLIRQASK